MIVYLTEEKPMLVRVHRRVCVERGAAAAAKWAEKKRIKRSKCKRRKRRSCWPMAVAANLQIRERVSEQSISE
jgi:hypothetical protein